MSQRKLVRFAKPVGLNFSSLLFGVVGPIPRPPRIRLLDSSTKVLNAMTQIASTAASSAFARRVPGARRIALATFAVTTVAGTAGSGGSQDGTGTAARFSSPTGLLFDGAGSLYISDNGNYTVRKLALGTLAVTTMVGTAPNPGATDGTGAIARFKNPISATVDGVGNLNGDYESAYIRWLRITCRSRNLEPCICSAERHTPRSHSAA